MEFVLSYELAFDKRIRTKVTKVSNARVFMPKVLSVF